ncbi:MAG TPA: hypothetical protein VJP02_07050 [Candidatus Sulfotelmatobacter sp.]|nr:hypothetical protein [Candidatus Sulfotelmatobacter sp.]
MYRVVPVCVLLCLSCSGFGQTATPNAAPAAAPLQLVYAIDGSTLTTYNVDRQTLQATQVGATTVQQSVYPTLTTSPNGEIIYYTAFQNTNQQGERLYVYNTTGSGVPETLPIQTLNATGFSSLQVDPTNKFLYLVHQGAIGSQYTTYTIRRFVINQTNGKISQAVTEATYKLDSVISGLYCSLSIDGINAAGTKLYDVVSCSYPHGGTSATYYERSVDPQTGTLGPDQEIYNFNNNSGEDNQQVQFVKNLMFDFVSPNTYPTANVVNVYPIKPNVKTPLISCTGSMLADCGSNFFGVVHPSAEYLFMINPQTFGTSIDKVEVSSRQIVGTLSTIPYEVQQFSPDGTIAYAANDVNTALDIEIYGFSVSNAKVRAGGLIYVPSDLDSWFPAERR